MNNLYERLLDIFFTLMNPFKNQLLHTFYRVNIKYPYLVEIGQKSLCYQIRYSYASSKVFTVLRYYIIINIISYLINVFVFASIQLVPQQKLFVLIDRTSCYQLHRGSYIILSVYIFKETNSSRFILSIILQYMLCVTNRRAQP